MAGHAQLYNGWVFSLTCCDGERHDHHFDCLAQTVLRPYAHVCGQCLVPLRPADEARIADIARERRKQEKSMRIELCAGFDELIDDVLGEPVHSAPAERLPQSQFIDQHLPAWIAEATDHLLIEPTIAPCSAAQIDAIVENGAPTQSQAHSIQARSQTKSSQPLSSDASSSAKTPSAPKKRRRDRERERRERERKRRARDRERERERKQRRAETQAALENVEPTQQPRRRTRRNMSGSGELAALAL